MRFITFEKIFVDVDEGKLLDKDGDVDCFVNGTNANLEHIGQVSKMLREAGGDSYERECEKVRPRMRRLKTSECLVAKTGFSLKTKHVIHVACPVKRTEIFDMVFNCLETAAEKKLKSVALAFLSSGTGNFDIQFCSLQYALAILEFSRTRTNTFVVVGIFFIDKDPVKVKVVNEMFEKIIPNIEMRLLEVPTQYYDHFPRLESSAEDLNPYGLGNEEREGSAENDRSEQENTSGQDSVDGRRSFGHGHHSHEEGDSDNNMVESGGTQVDMRRENENNVEEVDNEYEIPIRSNDAQSGHSDSGRNIPMYSSIIGKYTLIIDKRDIRDATAVAIVCPENCETPFGGFLSVATKCRFQRHNTNPLINSKVSVKRQIATTEVTSDDGLKQYLLHVPVTVWKLGMDKGEFERCLTATVEQIFEKLRKPVHRKRNITSIAIPLLGLESVENVETVSNCCQYLVETICALLSHTDIPNLQEVYLLNRCKKITNTLISYTKISLVA